MASYDAYGRPLRGHEPSHFETSDSSAADYNYPQHSEARDIPIHNRRESPRRRSPPLGSERMASSVDSRDQAPSMADGVSPELIAAITEKVKKEGGSLFAENCLVESCTLLTTHSLRTTQANKH